MKNPRKNHQNENLNFNQLVNAIMHLLPSAISLTQNGQIGIDVNDGVIKYRWNDVIKNVSTSDSDNVFYTIPIDGAMSSGTYQLPINIVDGSVVKNAYVKVLTPFDVSAEIQLLGGMSETVLMSSAGFNPEIGGMYEIPLWYDVNDQSVFKITVNNLDLTPTGSMQLILECIKPINIIPTII